MSNFDPNPERLEAIIKRERRRILLLGLSLGLFFLAVGLGVVSILRPIVAPPAFAYYNADGSPAAPVAIYQPEHAGVCPGDTLEWAVHIRVSAEAVPMAVQPIGQFIFPDGTSAAPAAWRSETQVPFTQPISRTSELTTTVLSRLAPGPYIYQVATISYVRDVAGYRVPFEVLPPEACKLRTHNP